jgi:hypothetical protein
MRVWEKKFESKPVHNERVKYMATYLKNAGVGALLVGTVQASRLFRDEERPQALLVVVVQILTHFPLALAELVPAHFI